jgi:HJR/Mrr/RecB family endonuclease
MSFPSAGSMMKRRSEVRLARAMPRNAEQVEAFNLQIARDVDVLLNLHTESSGRTFNLRKKSTKAQPLSTTHGVYDDFNKRTAAIAFVVMLPAFFTLLFGAFELFKATHIELAALFSALMCSAVIVYVARGRTVPRLQHELTSYSVAGLFCLPAWILCYLVCVSFTPVHNAMAIASFLATALNLYLGGPFGEKKRRATANIGPRPLFHMVLRPKPKSTESKSLPLFSARPGRLKRDYLAHKPEAVAKYYQLFFARSPLAGLFEHSLSFAYCSGERELVIDGNAPGPEIFGLFKGAKFARSSDSVKMIQSSDDERTSLHREFLASWALRMAADALLADRANALDSVVFNAFIIAADPATGKDSRLCLLSVRVSADELKELDIARVEKIACLRRLGARLSSNGSKVQIVQPLRTTSSTASKSSHVSGDSLALHKIDPIQFEHLVSHLLERMGLQTELTRASHDGGIDIVAVDKRPILGGKIVVQAKRYRHTVPVSCVRDLYGAMQHEGASKAILVTSSKFGPDAWQFAEGKPIQLIEGSHLVDLLKTHGIAAHL